MTFLQSNIVVECNCGIVVVQVPTNLEWGRSDELYSKSIYPLQKIYRWLLIGREYEALDCDPCFPDCTTEVCKSMSADNKTSTAVSVRQSSGNRERWLFLTLSIGGFSGQVLSRTDVLDSSLLESRGLCLSIEFISTSDVSAYLAHRRYINHCIGSACVWSLPSWYCGEPENGCTFYRVLDSIYTAYICKPARREK